MNQLFCEQITMTLLHSLCPAEVTSTSLSSVDRSEPLSTFGIGYMSVTVHCTNPVESGIPHSIPCHSRATWHGAGGVLARSSRDAGTEPGFGTETTG
jgi:hypothetical protein